MKSSILQGPTLANPAAFNTVEELREQLTRANEILFDQFLLSAQRDDLINQLVVSHNNVLLAHIAGNSDGIKSCLEAYLNERPRLREKLEECVESTRIRNAH